MMKVLVIEKGKEPYYAILTPSMVARKYSKKIYLSTGRQTGKTKFVEELQKLIRKQNGGPAGEREQKRVYNRKKKGTEKQKNR